MTTFHKLKNRPTVLSLLAIACALSLAASCSHKQKEDGTEADAATDPNAAPAAGTDAAPSADGQAAAATDPNAVTTAATDAPQPPAGKHKGKKGKRHAKNHDTAAASPEASESQNAAAMQSPPTESTMAQTQAPPPPTPSQQPAQKQAAQNPSMGSVQNQAIAQNTPPQDPPTANPSATSSNSDPNAAARNPASARGGAPRADNVTSSSAGEISAEGGGGLMETFAAYRSMLIALAGVGLLGFGGFTFWKKRQEMAS